jgi:phage tail sheath gpL-like
MANQVPQNIEVPFVYIAIDNTGSFEGVSSQNFNVLIVGSSKGTAEEGKVYPILSLTQAKALFGYGSDLYLMAEYFGLNDSTSRLFGVGITSTNLTNASCSIQVAFPQGKTKAASNGTIKITVNDIELFAPYSVDDTAAIIEKKVKSVLANVPYLSTDAEDDGAISVTAVPKGEIGNFAISVENLDTKSEVQVSISGLTNGKTTNGTAIPDTAYNSIFTNLPDEQYNLIVSSIADPKLAKRFDQELADRFGPLRQKDGCSVMAVAAKDQDGIEDDLLSLNSQFVALLAVGDTPTPAFLFAAAAAGQIAASAAIDPARPFQTLELRGRFAPPATKATFQQRNSLLRSGVSTIVFDQSNTPRIERIVTTYLTNDAGAEDRSYHDLNTLLTLSFIRNDFRNFLLSRYGRSKVANDDTKFAAGVQVITPKLAKAETIARFRQYESLGFVENVDTLKSSLIVRRSPQDPNRLDFILKPNLVNPLTVIGVDLGFIL